MSNVSSAFESTGSEPTDPPVSPSGDLQPPQFGRYKVAEELGRGGMGIVYRAFDPVLKRDVALKTLPSSDPRLLSRFKREFRLVTEVDHPNLVKLFELASDGQTWYFTMELVEGVDPLAYVNVELMRVAADPEGDEAASHSALDAAAKRSSPDPGFAQPATRQERFRDCFVQLAGAIAALHENGIVHRDIKPSNVLVTPEHRVVLLDFGLLAEIDSSGTHVSWHQQLLGTAAYMSPEQAACEAVSFASDWYAVGVMMYQMLTGKLPFAGSVREILRDKQAQDPVPPALIDPLVDKSWNSLCMALLSRLPEQRPAAGQILRRLGTRMHSAVSGSSTRSDEVALVGRERPLRLLRNSLQAMRSGQSQSVLIDGGSGTGKTALVDCFLEQAETGGVIVLKGRCYEMESVPFKGIDGLIDSLEQQLRKMPRDVVAALMPRDVHMLTRLFPIIGRLQAVSDLPQRRIDLPDRQELNRRAIAALRELLARMGDRYPLVIFIDDLQWGDEDSARMLSDLLQPPDAPILLFLGTYRTEDAETSAFLQSFRQLQRQREQPLKSAQIRLEPLRRYEAVSLALLLLDDNGAEAQRHATAIAGEAAGNPFFVAELVKHLQLDGDRVSGSAVPLGIFDMIWSRVQRLPNEAQRLLAVVALSGQPMPLDRALHIAGAGPSALGPLRIGHLIRTVGLASSFMIETYHDRVREAISARLSQDERRKHHLRIAEAYVELSPRDGEAIMERLVSEYAEFGARCEHAADDSGVASWWFEAAFHFDAAGRADLAFPYALATAANARRQFSLELAEQQFRIAERGVSNQAVDFRYRVAEGLGEVLMLRGRYDEAAVRFQSALQLTHNPMEIAQTEGALAELAFKCGDMSTAINATEHALRMLGNRIPTRPIAFSICLLREVFVQALHTLLPYVFVARRKLDGAERELLSIRLHNRLTYCYWFGKDKQSCLWTHLRGMNFAERFPPTSELAQSYSIHAPVMSLIPYISRGLTYAQKSFAVYESMGDLWGQGQSQNFYGMVFYVASRYEESIDKFRAAERLLERTGDLWEVNIARVHIANCLYRMGDLRGAADLAQRVHLAGMELGDLQATAITLDVWTLASGGEVDPAVLQAELRRPRSDVQVKVQLMLAEGVRLFMRDDIGEATEVLTEARRIAVHAGVKNAWTVPLHAWLASSLRRQAQIASVSQVRFRRNTLKRAATVARSAVKVAKAFRNDLPHALRELGRIRGMQGCEKRARRCLDESLELAHHQGASFEYAHTLWARGTLGLTFDWPEADEQVAAAHKSLCEIGGTFVL